MLLFFSHKNPDVIVTCQKMALVTCSCFVHQEAKALSSLKPELDSRGVGLYAVVHETPGVPSFKSFFDGEIFYDAEVLSLFDLWLQ